MINKTYKRTWWLATALLLMFALVLSACGDGSNEPNDSNDSNNSGAIEEDLNYTGETAYSNATNPVATIEMENGGVIRIELYPELAPNTVHNFISLANKGYYDGLIFHRVIENFMIQGGDPEGTGAGGPGYTIVGEFNTAGFDNDLPHDRGVISMARMGGILYDTAGSQFFIMHKDSPHLDNDYAAFGRVIEGIEVVDQIAAVRTDGADKPREDQVMKKVSVDTRGVTYPEPEVLKVD